MRWPRNPSRAGEEGREYTNVQSLLIMIGYHKPSRWPGHCPGGDVKSAQMQLARLLRESPRVAGGLCYLSDTEVQFAAGLTVVAYDPENGRQRCMLPSPPSGAATVSLTALALSESRR